jgi:hypothetical protein
MRWPQERAHSAQEDVLPTNNIERETEAMSGVSRRNLMSRVGISATAAAFLSTMGPIGAALVSGTAHAQSVTFSDSDILNFALNLEYLEGEYYNRGATGVGLPASSTTGTGTPGGVNGGTVVPFQTPYFFEIAAKIAIDELDHVNFLRSQLGSAAVARPLIDLAGSFQAAALASGAIAPGQVFNPFADEISFFLGAFTLTEVGVTAYTGAAALISNPAILSAAASILAIEAYHAGSIRGVLTQSSIAPNANSLTTLVSADLSNGSLLPFRTQAIANAQSQESNALTAIGILNPQNGGAQISARDSNALAFQRTPSQVISVVEGGPSHAGGNFFPNGLNGNIH